ncbi:MAG: hypothetical protein QXZ12_05250 [Thermoplasmata archaeon]
MRKNKDIGKPLTNNEEKDDKLIDSILKILVTPMTSEEILKKINATKIDGDYITIEDRTIRRRLKKLKQEGVVRLVDKAWERKKYGIYNTDKRSIYYIANPESIALNQKKMLIHKIEKISNVSERNSCLSIVLDKEPYFSITPTLNERVMWIMHIWDADIKREDMDTYNIYYLNQNLPAEQATDFNLLGELGMRLTIYLDFLELVILLDFLQFDKENLDFEVRVNLINHIRKKLNYYLSTLQKKLVVSQSQQIAVPLPDLFSEIEKLDQTALSINVIIEALKILDFEKEDIGQDLREILDIIIEDKNRTIAYRFLEIIIMQKPESIRSYFKDLIPILYKKSDEIFETDPYFRSLANKLAQWASDDSNKKQ